MVERLNVGIVGARRGTALVGGFRARENVEVTALCDIVSAIREDREPNIDVNRALDFTLPGLMSQVLIADGGRPVKVPDFRAGHWR